MEKFISRINTIKYLLMMALFLYIAYQYFRTDRFTYIIILNFYLLIVFLSEIIPEMSKKYDKNSNERTLAKRIRELEDALDNNAGLSDKSREDLELFGNEIKYTREKLAELQAGIDAKEKELAALRDITEIKTATSDLDMVIGQIYSVFKTFTDCDRCLVSWIDKNSGELICRYEYGDIILNEKGKAFNEDSIIKSSFTNKQIIIKTNVFIDKRGIYGDKLSIPMSVSGEMAGVIFLETGKVNSFSDKNSTFLTSLANYTAMAIKNAELFHNIFHQKQEIEALYEETSAVNEELNSYIDDLNKAKEELKRKNEDLTRYYDEIQTGYLQTVMSLANAIEASDPYTRGHCQRVMEISCEIAGYMGFSDEEVGNLRYAAILHDIGKIGIPAYILNKDGKLTEEEYEEVKKHPMIACNILNGIGFLKDAMDAILQHHERYDGKGYPYGIAGDKLSKAGQILCIADAFDAMTSDRPYRKGMSMEAAVAEIKRCKGTQFDPEITDLFLRMSDDIICNNG